jgi:hypothetical protein
MNKYPGCRPPLYRPGTRRAVLTAIGQMVYDLRQYVMISLFDWYRVWSGSTDFDHD